MCAAMTWPTFDVGQPCLNHVQEESLGGKQSILECCISTTDCEGLGAKINVMAHVHCMFTALNMQSCSLKVSCLLHISNLSSRTDEALCYL